MSRRFRLFLAGVAATAAVAVPIWAITNGQPDAGEHPYVGQLLFYVPDDVDPRSAIPARGSPAPERY